MSTSQQPMHVLVTGGSGFLGSHIVQQLLRDTAIYVDIVSRAPKEKAMDHVSCHSADISSLAQIQAIFDKVRPQVVIHTASPHYTDLAAVLERTNIEGTRVLLDCARACESTRAFIYTSSDSAVMPTQEPLTEDKAQLYTASQFNNVYGKTKGIADAMVQAANTAGLSTAVIRLPGLYGENDTEFVAQLVSSVRKKEHRMQVGQNKKHFEFAYVEKAAEAHLLAMRALLDPTTADSVAGEAFFVSDGRSEPFFDFVRRCYAAAGNPVAPHEVTTIPLAAMQAMASAGEWAYKIFTVGSKTPTLRRVAMDYLDRGCCWSIEKAKLRLGYEPVADQDAAIKRSMEWGMATL